MEHIFWQWIYYNFIVRGHDPVLFFQGICDRVIGLGNYFILLWQRIYDNFIDNGRYSLFINALWTTLIVTFFAFLIGLSIGTLLAIMKTSGVKLGKRKILDIIANIYIDIIRGTPMVIQLLIMYFVIFATPNVPKIVVAIVAFGINSAAYVAEIVRGGILAVDSGQMEAGRSLGLSKFKTMIYIIMPQAIKHIIPPMGNELIILLKETAIVGWIGLEDLTKIADMVRGRTLDAFVSLIGTAIIYFILIKILSVFLRKLERRLRRSDLR